MDYNLFSLFFETVSAFGTVGFSLGATGDLSFAGKFIIMGMMFVGRIGIFTFLIAFFQKQKKPLYHYPEEKLNIL